MPAAKEGSPDHSEDLLIMFAGTLGAMDGPRPAAVDLSMTRTQIERHAR
jgi:hypothetical protein